MVGYPIGMNKIWIVLLVSFIACSDEGGDSELDANPMIVDGGGEMRDAPPVPNEMSDEFADNIDLLADNTSGWSILGAPPTNVHGDTRLFIADIGVTRTGWLVLVPQEGYHYAWFQDDWGPFLYRTITGNFAVATRLRVVCKSQTPDADCRPSPGYNAGGFVFRDPAGTENGDENWVMYNMGGQGPGGYAREIKKTVESTSSLFLNAQAQVSEYFLGCRIGPSFYFFFWDDIDGSWRQEQFHNNSTLHGTPVHTQVGGAGFGPVIQAFSDPGDGNSTNMWFEHNGLPETLQVGLISHNWDDSVAQDTRSEFDFVRFSDSAPMSVEDCLATFADLGDGG